MQHKQYILLAGNLCYPLPGLNDIKESFDALPEAFSYWKDNRVNNEWSWYQIANRDTWQIEEEYIPGG